MKARSAVILLASTLLLVAQDWQIAKPGYRFEFPRDHFSHPEFATEWWYYTGHLEAADGRRWGFELVTFQIQRASIDPYYVAHFAVTDRQRGQFRYADRQSQGAQVQPTEGFAFDVGGWKMAGLLGDDRDRLDGR